MISTRLQDGALLYLYHRLTGQVDEDEVRAGILDAHAVIKSAIYEFEATVLVLDLRDVNFTDLNAHRLWSAGLREDDFINKYIEKVALIGSPGSSFEAEQEGLSTEDMRFFLTLEEARDWIRSFS